MKVESNKFTSSSVISVIQSPHLSLSENCCCPLGMETVLYKCWNCHWYEIFA